ncbi:MAG: phosphatidylserine/phosphatidylglycerophosphate/cardiolipin synthase family protein, partial [Lachnospiraceae bacterium]|nr:phosphatidylserine/phosphatidylglycerophosphate/cardiolipin synthase family protein [Lachnospiraceae bacterium]
MIELISEKTREQIEELFNKSESSIQIVSPFLSVKTAEMLCKICKKRNINCTLVTRIYIKDLIDGVNSLKALKLLLEAGVEIYAIKGLHAKLYMFDEEYVIIGSANFTLAGLEKNFELSILTDDLSVKEKAQFVIDDLIAHCKENEGFVTKELIEQIEETYIEADKTFQKDSTTISYKMFGANRKIVGTKVKDVNWEKKEIEKVDVDPIHDLFADNSSKRTDFKHQVWAKFEGNGDDRIPGDEIPSIAEVTIDGKPKYIVNFTTRPSGINTGDKLFLFSYTTDNNGKPAIRIVGRGKAVNNYNKNRVEPEWTKEYPWMKKYQRYCEITDLELLNLPRKDCISLEQVHDVLGNRTYVTTLDKDELTNLSLVRCRKSHLRLTIDAL